MAKKLSNRLMYVVGLVGSLAGAYIMLSIAYGSGNLWAYALVIILLCAAGRFFFLATRRRPAEKT